MRVLKTLANAPRIAVLPAILGCVITILAGVPVPQSAANLGAPLWGAPPAPVKTHTLDSFRADWAGVRPAFQPFAALGHASDCPLPAWQSYRIATEPDAAPQAPSAGVHLARAPPRNPSL